MLVNKPMFDVESIKIGSAYWLIKRNIRSSWQEISQPCLITKVTPLNVYVVYTDEKTGKISEINITINEIVDKRFELETMKVEGDK